VQDTVVAAMLRHPMVCPASLSAGQAHELFRDDHLHVLLLLEGAGTLVAVVERSDLAAADGASTPARALGRLTGRTVGPEADLERTRLHLVRSGRRRLAVVDDEHRLLGLLCLKRTGLGFCSDADVEARAEERSIITRSGSVPPVGLEPTLRPF
jgi:hypothetical protein